MHFWDTFLSCWGESLAGVGTERRLGTRLIQRHNDIKYLECISVPGLPPATDLHRHIWKKNFVRHYARHIPLCGEQCRLCWRIRGGTDTHANSHQKITARGSVAKILTARAKAGKDDVSRPISDSSTRQSTAQYVVDCLLPSSGQTNQDDGPEMGAIVPTYRLAGYMQFLGISVPPFHEGREVVHVLNRT